MLLAVTCAASEVVKGLIEFVGLHAVQVQPSLALLRVRFRSMHD